jgi:translocation and assembly module TamB
VAATLRDVTAPLQVDALSGSAGIALRQSTIASFGIDRLDLNGSFADQILQLRTLDMDTPAGSAKATGALTLAETGESDLEYHLEALDLSAFSELAGRPLAGSVTVDGKVTGNREELQTKASLAANGVKYGETFEAMTTSGTVGATLRDLDPAQTGVNANVSSTLVRVAGQEVRSTTLEAEYAGNEATVDLRLEQEKRSVNARTRVLLHPDHSEVHVERFAAATAGVQWQTPAGAEATIDYASDRVRIDGFQLENGGQRLSVEGQVALAGDATSKLDVALENVSLADLVAVMLVERPITGRLDGNVHLGGTATEREAAGQLRISQGSVDQFAFESLSSEFGLQREMLKIDLQLTQRPGNALSVTGTMPTALLSAAGRTGPAASAPLDLRVQSSAIDLAIVQAASAELTNVKGTVRADLKVTGSASTPRLEGRLDIAGGAFRIRGTDSEYTGLDTTLEFEGDGVALRQFRILDDDQHPLDVAGRIGLQGVRVGGFDITLTARNFEVLDSPLGFMEVNADLAIRGMVTKPDVQGSVSLHSGRIEVDKVLETVTSGAYATEALPAGATAMPAAPDSKSAVPGSAAAASSQSAGSADGASASAQPAGEGAAAAPGIFDNTTLNVKIRIPENLILRGKDIRPANSPMSLGNLNVTVGGDFELRKPQGKNLALLGPITTVRGTYDFQGRRFNVERDGRITFRGEYPPNPALDVTASREIEGILARVNISGTARLPRLTLSSEPPLDQGDILSLIVFNQPINQLGEGQRTSLAERAGSLASGFVVSPIANSLERTLGLDTFEVQTFGEDGVAPAVTIGEQVGERLYVNLRQQFGGQEVTEFLLEYRLADFLRLRGAIAEGETRANRSLTRRVERGGIDLVFLFSY